MAGVPDPKQVLRDFLKTAHCVIADPNAGSRARLAGALIDFGSDRSRLGLSGTFEDAEREIRARKPKLVICEYWLGAQSGLDLIQHQRELQPGEKNSVFVLVSGDNSQAAVARAAEEDVDTFVLKPYTRAGLEAALGQAVKAKLFPSEYVQIIEMGKEMLYSGDPDAAIAHFERAMLLEASPTLACFYLGQAQEMKKALERAAVDFNQGLSFNRIHYKCLVGLHDNLLERGRTTEAYEIVRRLAHYFPANPKRLKSTLRLAILTQNIDDLTEYYRIFTKLEDRDDELIRYMCSALTVAARHYYVAGQASKAVDCVEWAAITCAGRTRFLRYLVELLGEFSNPVVGRQVLRRFPPETHREADYLTSEYLVLSAEKGARNVIDHGRHLLKNGIQNEIIHETMLTGMIEGGHWRAAEDLLFTVESLYPEQKGRFERFRRAIDEGKISG